MRITMLLAVSCAIFPLQSAATEDKSTAWLTANFKNVEENLTVVVESWENFETGIKTVVNDAIKLVLPRFMDSMGRLNLSRECMRNNMHLISGLKNIRPWAMRFLDSSGKIIDGLLEGSMSSFGSYDECIATEVRSTKLRDKGKLLFSGQYCTINMAPPMPPKPKRYKLDEALGVMKNLSQRNTIVGEIAKYSNIFHFLKLRFGICTASGCTLEDVNKIAKLVGNYLSLNATASRCEVKQENDFNPTVIGVMTAYSFAGLLVLVGTLTDIYAYYRKIIFKHKLLRILLAFSMFTNFQKFANTETASDTLSCLNGIRFLSMSWIILGHTYLIVNYQIFLQLMKARDYAGDFAFQAVINASVAVDTFFCVGGLLVCYLTIKLVRNQGHKFSVGLYIFHRLWRILPVYIFVIMFMFLVHLLGSGPIWHDTTHNFLKSCHDNWWTNLLFINNFYDAEHMCIPQSWYIASDFQLHVGALVILLPMIRWPKVGIFLCILGVIASVAYSGIATYMYSYPPTMLFSYPDLDQLSSFWSYFYFRPFIHAGPYCIGLLTGYILATRPNLKIPKLVQMIGWCVAFTCSFSVLYGVLEWNRGVDPSFFSTIVYASFNRVAWTLGVAWMILCCATGHGGVINYILSWKAFVPLGRLTYVAYLTHLTVQMVAVGNVRTQMMTDHFFAVWIFFGHLCVSYGTAFAGSMLIESPFMALEKIMFARPEEKDSTPFMKQNSILKGTLSEKNVDIIAIVPKTDEESGGVDNKAIIVQRL